ncbi:MAG: VOC family protein [Pseudomonadota bacterium]
MSTMIIPCLRYRNAVMMIEWLCDAFGFERHLVVEDGAGGIAHAQLVFGGGMIMLGSDLAGEFREFMAMPSDTGGRETQCAYIIVSDVDAHHARAEAAGAETIIAPRDEEYGGRGYSCRDPEGHIWSFGSYDPWANHGET